jgi:hypothetical protein
MSISLSLVASRTSGVGPLAVFFDASGTTSTQTSNPFHEVYYSWNFGDSNGNAAWTYGTRTGSGSKNVAYGPLASHVFENPGTYTVTLTGFDGVSISQNSVVITVTDPATVYSQRHFYSNDTTYAVGTPADNGTTVFRHDSTSDFDAAIATDIATNRALYFEWGDSFASSSAASVIVDGPGTIGANPYGSGTKPSITGNVGKFSLGNSTNNDFADWRIVDLSMPASGAGNTITLGGTVDGLLVLNCDITNTSHGVYFPINTLDAHNNPTKIQNIYKNVFIVGCVIDTVDQYHIFGGAENLVILGNKTTVATNAHSIRTQWSRNAVISNNEIGTAFQTCLTIRGVCYNVADRTGSGVLGFYTLEDQIYTERNIVSDNKMIGGAGVNPLFSYTTITSGLPETRFRNSIVERNWIILGGAGAGNTNVPFQFEGQLISIRNNLFDTSLSSAPAGETGIQIAPQASSQTVDSVWVYHNTHYSSRATGTLVFFNEASTPDPTNIKVKNNLIVAPDNSSASTDPVTGTYGAGFDEGTGVNSTQAQIQGTSPLSTTPPTTPAHWQITVSTYPVGAGEDSLKVFDDFFENIRDWSTPDTDIGAHAKTSGSLPAITTTTRGFLSGLG